MKSYAIFGAGFLSGAVLISGIFLISTRGGVVVYTSPDTSRATVLVGSGDTDAVDTPPSEALNDENEKQEEELVERKKGPSSRVTQPEVEESRVQSVPSNDYIIELQEQVDSLIEQVSTQTAEPVETATEESDSDEVFFMTPTGIKMDADGNVINESSSQSGDTAQKEETQQTDSEVFTTPTGVKIDADGNVIGESVSQNVNTPLEPGVFITPAGVKIDAEGNVIE